MDNGIFDIVHLTSTANEAHWQLIQLWSTAEESTSQFSENTFPWSSLFHWFPRVSPQIFREQDKDAGKRRKWVKSGNNLGEMRDTYRHSPSCCLLFARVYFNWCCSLYPAPSWRETWHNVGCFTPGTPLSIKDGVNPTTMYECMTECFKSKHDYITGVSSLYYIYFHSFL